MSKTTAHPKMVGLTEDTHAKLNELAWRNRTTMQAQIEHLVLTEYARILAADQPKTAPRPDVGPKAGGGSC